MAIWEAATEFYKELCKEEAEEDLTRENKASVVANRDSLSPMLKWEVNTTSVKIKAEKSPMPDKKSNAILEGWSEVCTERTFTKII